MSFRKTLAQFKCTSASDSPNERCCNLQSSGTERNRTFQNHDPISVRTHSPKTKRPRFLAAASIAIKLESVEPQSHFHVDLHCHRLAVRHGGFNLPGFHRFHGFLVQSQTKRASLANIARAAIRAND